MILFAVGAFVAWKDKSVPPLVIGIVGGIAEIAIELTTF